MRANFLVLIKWSILLFPAISTSTFATQPPGKNAWDELNPQSQAYAVMKRRCQEEAAEKFFGTVEHVSGIYLESEDKALSYVDGSSESYGINYSNPPYMYLRNGLRFVEYSSDFSAMKRFQQTKDSDDYRYMRFDTKARNTTPVKERSASIRISYKRTTTDGEEELGVHGRLIEVIDDSTHTLLAQRRDFIWLNHSRSGPHGGFVCPTLEKAEYMPISFLNKVINVQSYSCWKTFESAFREVKNTFDSRVINPIRDRMEACEKNYFN